MRFRSIVSGLRRLLAATLLIGSSAVQAAEIDLGSDTWVATDGLGRSVPNFPATLPARADRTVAMFYFLWHGEHIQGGPFDISRILKTDPEAMQKPDSPLWGPLNVPHHWGESIFGYYRTRDDGVLRKHAQMLADAGVDAVVFDVTNQFTYRDDYMALLRVWSEMRALGNRTPTVAFLTPFWAPAKVTRELWRDLYGPGLYRDLWFQWDGKPLILADAELIYDAEENAHQNTPTELRAGHTLGQSFTTEKEFASASGRFPTWNKTDSALTLTLKRDGPKGETIISQQFENVGDNSWLRLKLTNAAPAGTYYLEASEPKGQIGWWSHSEEKFARGEAFADGAATGGDRTLRLETSTGEADRIQNFFTFRRPQADYFRGPTQANMWSWLEVSPQHRFTNSAGVIEQMAVGVAQNAVQGRLGSMSEPLAHGRSFIDGAMDTRPDAVRYGLNFSNQWARAIQEDPRLVFVTGWNEWIAGRFAEFSGVKLPVMFVDQFDQEHSRDIEPMRSGHGDDYYWQLVSNVRRYKGTRALPKVAARPIKIDGDFSDWRDAEPEFRDTIGDQARRDFRGWDEKVTYRNTTGRNDIVAAKVSWDAQKVYFYVRTREAITKPEGTNWMNLLIDIDANKTTGWMGYDYIVNRGGAGVIVGPKANTWTSNAPAAWRVGKNEMELSMPWPSLGLNGPPAKFDFKWTDNCFAANDWTDFTLNGDAAPNDRFNYRALLRPE
jgi:hypothetical protein